jgi:hypothetical protein
MRVERVGLDQDALQIHRGEQLPQNRALVLLAGVIGGWAIAAPSALE